MEFYQEIEKALTKEYRKTLWRPFMAAVKEYHLLDDGDQIAVCVSGGKDSMLLAKLMQELKRHSPLSLDLVFLCMDPGYSPENRNRILENSQKLNIPLQFFETNIFETVEAEDQNPCHLCAKMRRGYLYRRAKALGCNKIALGHHYDDAIETLLLSMLYAGQIQGMMPRLKSESIPDMQLIRPMFHIREAEILRWRDENALEFINCACRATKNAQVSESGASDSKRLEIKQLIRHLNTLNPNADKNIFRSMHNVSLDGVIAWKQGGQTHSFLESFDLD